jgi:hypothetical protein
VGASIIFKVMDYSDLEPLESFFEVLGGRYKQYLPALLAEGWTSLELLKSVEIDDLRDIGVPGADARIIFNASRGHVPALSPATAPPAAPAAATALVLLRVSVVQGAKVLRVPSLMEIQPETTFASLYEQLSGGVFPSLERCCVSASPLHLQTAAYDNVDKETVICVAAKTFDLKSVVFHSKPLVAPVDDTTPQKDISVLMKPQRGLPDFKVPAARAGNSVSGKDLLYNDVIAYCRQHDLTFSLTGGMEPAVRLLNAVVEPFWSLSPFLSYFQDAGKRLSCPRGV